MFRKKAENNVESINLFFGDWSTRSSTQNILNNSFQNLIYFFIAVNEGYIPVINRNEVQFIQQIS